MTTPLDEGPTERMDRLERNLNDMRDQVDRKEHRARKRRYILSCLALVGILSLLTARATKTTSLKIVQAEKFELLDKDGNVRGEFNVSEKGIIFAMYDQNAANLLHIQAFSNGSTGLQVYDPTGKPRLTIGSKQGGVGMTVSDEGGQKRISVGTNMNGDAGIEVYDDKGNLLVKLPSTSPLTPTTGN